MAYEGSVELISGLKQKNGLSFPLVDAKDVYVDDSTRLDVAINGKEDIMYRADMFPAGGFSRNTLYELGTLSGATPFTFNNGLSSDDMIYISFIVGDELAISFSNNIVGINSPSLIPGYMMEIIAIWNSALNKWICSYREVEL